LYVTTHKNHSVKGFLNAAASHHPGSAQLKAIDVSHMDHIMVGQLTKRFDLARSTDCGNLFPPNGGAGDESTMMTTGGIDTFEELSLSLFYRETGQRPKEGGNTSQVDKQRKTLETLDLIVLNAEHHKNLCNALNLMITAYRKCKTRNDSTTQLLEYLWTDLGKELKDTLSTAEWLDLCERLYMPFKKPMLTTMYKEVVRQLPTQRRIGGGLPLWAAAQLLDDVRFLQGLDVPELRTSQQDAMLRIWNEVWLTDPIPAMKSGQVLSDAQQDRPDPSELAQSISAVAFLSFLRTKQREFSLSIEDVLDRICLLNGRIEADPRLPRVKFFLYLLSDANDALNPSRGRVGGDDMTHPLSHYWICSSHDTYLSHWTKESEYDEYMYLSALYRGVRCLELDVHDNGDMPVISRQSLTGVSNPEFLSVTKVLKLLREFLLRHPKCYPVILNIENHCSFENQQRLASELFGILGKSGLIVVPDDTASIDATDLLPSPHAMRGKVLIMGKRPKVIEEGAKVVNDDYDNENDEFYTDNDLPNAASRDEEEAALDSGVVIGFDSGGPIRAPKNHEENIVQHSAGELLFLSKKDLEDAKIETAKAELEAHRMGEEADKAEQEADRLIDAAGFSKETILQLALRLKGEDIDTGDQTLTACRATGEGLEIQEFFGDTVENDRASCMHAEILAIDAAQEATEFLHKLNEATVKLREAETKLEASYALERKQVAKYQKVAADARAKREDADFAKARLSKLRTLLIECEETVTTAENVVTTAMTESKISEKRAAETEARAARAASKAKEDRRKADVETKEEEALEKEASIIHEELNNATDRVTAAKKSVNEAAQMAARLNEQIKLIETSTQYKREKKDQASALVEEKKDNGTLGKVLLKHAAKLEERRLSEIKVRLADKELNEFEKKVVVLKAQFERAAHQWKTQSDVASRLRRQADKSISAAEELAEHAEEEREAANLRHTAREKATSNVSEKDAYRKSLIAQVDEAQRAAADLEGLAQAAKTNAENLQPSKEELPDHEKNVKLVERRKLQRDNQLATYNSKKIKKEEAEARALEAKRMFENSDSLFNEAMLNAAKDQIRSDHQKVIDRKAILAFNRARLLRQKAEHSLEDARFSQSKVVERQIIVKRATEYTEKMARITPIPTSLAKMTFLHTTKHRHWEKSLNLPNTHVHSFSHGVLDKMHVSDSTTTTRMKEFTTEHLCRTFHSWKNVKSKDKINSEPLDLWALGCQLVSLNYGNFDEHILKADGRFRRNGSCGYVLKPEHLLRDDPLPERVETWSIDIIGGNCLPSPETVKTKAVNPFVRVSIYSGYHDSKKTEHRTKVIMKNGFNPVWDESNCVKFTSKNPSMSLCIFTVWHKGETSEEFIAGASIPVSCLREGFRSIALFDTVHARQGPYAFASLLVNLSRSRK